jgi:uncharacterized cupin superfamily protein
MTSYPSEAGQLLGALRPGFNFAWEVVETTPEDYVIRL